MYKVKDLSKPLLSLDGQRLISGPEGQNLTIKTVLVTYLSMYQCEGASGEELVRAYDLGKKVHSCKDGLELDDDQFKFIEKVIVTAHQPLYVAVAIGQVLEKLRESKIPGRNEIGRNDLCPCGSGKKFKKCCYK